MQRVPATVCPEARLREALQVMDEHGFGLLLVATKEGRLDGFLTRAFLNSVTDWEQAVGDVRFEAKFAVAPEDTLEKAALILLANQLVLLPVVEGGRLVGIVTQGEILRAMAHGLGVGLEAIRIVVLVRPESDDLFRILHVLERHDVRLVSMIRGRNGAKRERVILRVQHVADRDALFRDLDIALQEEKGADEEPERFSGAQTCSDA
ncbi:CBS domain-containing protein [Candidatus Bipolaricaulota bacterium]|nr:CBS domain-containing protein [Candidatus Bipolaricaulota bacterium]